MTRLPESLRLEGSSERLRVVSWRGFLDTVKLPGVGLLVLVGFLGVLGFALFEGTFALYLGGRFGWD